MCKSNKKLFVGGYYNNEFKDEYLEGMIPFDKGIDTYTLEEALKLPFIESIKDLGEEGLKDLYNRVYNKDLIKELKERGLLEKDEEDLTFFDFDDFTDKEKKDLILKYTSTDEIATLLYFDTEEETEEYKNEVLEEIKKISTYEDK